MGRQAEPAKFIVVGLGRCGSNLLKFAIKQNPQVKMIGEYFNGRVYPEALTEDGRERARLYFEGARRRAIGFKLFVHQAVRKPAKTVWQYLGEETSIRVIHLSRRNSFERNLSLEVAKVRGQWLADDRGTDDLRINLPPAQWRKRLKADAQKERELERLFAAHPRLHLDYQDLTERWKEVTLEVQSFLSVPPVELSQTLQKQETMPPAMRCPNYPELVTFFSGTRWGWMFY
jgi:hypothetical protein